jgi:hypothetical protein
MNRYWFGVKYAVWMREMYSVDADTQEKAEEKLKKREDVVPYSVKNPLDFKPVEDIKEVIEFLEVDENIEVNVANWEPVEIDQPINNDTKP